MSIFSNINADIGKLINTVGTVNDLRAMNLRKVSDGDTVMVSANLVIGDGSGGVYVWSDRSTLADDGIKVLRPSGAVGKGRWLLSVGSGSAGPRGDVGGSSESAGTFVEAKAVALDPTGGTQQVRLVDRAKATFNKTTETLDPAGQNLDWFTDAQGKKWRLPDRINLDAKNLGAGVGLDDTLAMARALGLARDQLQTNFAASTAHGSANAGVMLSPGTYYAGDIQHSIYTNSSAVNKTGTSKLVLCAETPGTVTIVIPSGKYFMEIGGRYDGVFVDGIRFVGGKGAFKFTHDGNNVNYSVNFTNCEFMDYTEAAITNAANDAPYLRVINNFFYGSEGSMGIAWGGYCDLMHIEKNQFLLNKYHIKIGDRLSGSITIRGNDFIKAYEYTRTADIWIVPSVDFYSNGYGSVIDSNKFGNESLGINETRILVADENLSSGTHRGNRYDSASKSTGYVNGFVVRDNLFATKFITGNPALAIPDGNDAPIMKTRTHRLGGWQFSGNIVTGGRFQWLTFFENLPPTNETWQYQDWSVDVSSMPSFQYGVVNKYVGMIEDSNGNNQADNYTKRPFDVDEDGSVTFYNGSNLAAIGKSGATVTITPTTDVYGGQNVGLITLPTAADYISGDLQPFNYAGAIHWVRASITRSTDASRILREVFFEVVNKDTGTIACQRVIQTTGYSDIVFSYVPPSDTTANWQWRIRSVNPIVGNVNQFVAGRVFINVGKAPMRTTHLQSPGSAFNQAHLIMGAYHMWVDGSQKLRLKGDGAPTADTQGILVNGKITFVTAPTASTSAGEAGQVAVDLTYLYVCTAPNVWKRIAWATPAW